jgi:hypothetical protein
MAAQLLQLPVERNEAVMQPPSACSARLPGRFFIRGINIDGDNTISVGKCRIQRRIIRKPQITTEP